MITKKNRLSDVEKYRAKEKYRGVFEIQRSGDKTSSGEIGLDIRTHASPKVGQDQVSGGVSVLCWHAAPELIVKLRLIDENSLNCTGKIIPMYLLPVVY